MTRAAAPMLAAALWYASNGYHVFPCAVGAKEPLISREAGGRGLLDATTDKEQIRRWWTNAPNANIGLATEPSGLVVVDVDTKNSGDSTFESLREKVGPGLFDTVTAITPSGGQHLVYATDGTVVKSGAHVLGQGIDIRAAGGYIVVAPSVVAGKKYEWEVGYSPRDRKPSMWPDLLAAEIRQSASVTSAPLDAESKIAAGERNATLASIAGTLRRRGLDRDEITGALQVINFKRCKPPLRIADIDRIAESIARYEPTEVIGSVPVVMEHEVPIRSAIDVFGDIHNRVEERGLCLPFGIPALDSHLGGMYPGAVSVLGARTGVGKTSMGEHIAETAAATGRVLFVSLEMAAQRILERMAARHARIQVREYREMGRPMDDLSWLENLQLQFVSKSRKVSIDIIEQYVVDANPNLVIIDHARHIAGWFPGRTERTRADIMPAEIMQALTAMADRYATHVLLLSQCSRDADNKRPSLSDLRDSGAVEENADNVIFLHRPFQFADAENGPDNIAEVCLYKSREAGNVVAHMQWDGERMAYKVPSFEDSHLFRRCCDSKKKQRGMYGS